jgi:hypothetical protein
MRVVQNQDRLIFKAGCFKFVRDFAEGIFNESALELRLGTVRPTLQDFLRFVVALRYRLSEFTKLIE